MTGRSLFSFHILFFLSLQLLSAAERERPNVLFIMCDDHAATAVGAYGGRLASLNPTPNLDRLAKKGVIFDNVYCVNSICTPSRASILTGQYSHRNRVRDLYDPLAGDKNIFSREFKKAGYTTAVIGKWHLANDPGYCDYFAVLPGQGFYRNPIFNVSEGGEPKKIKYSSILTREIPIIRKKGHSTDVITDLSIEWLDKKRDKSKPFMLMHHFKAPHDYFTSAARYQKYLEDVEIPEPKTLHGHPDGKFGSVATRGENDSLVNFIGSSISNRARRSYVKYYEKEIKELAKGQELTEREKTSLAYQIYLKKYLRCVKGVDDNLQRLIDYLEKNDLLENTIIVYTSDQGMMLGEHDFGDKRWMYEESLKMPFVVHYPKLVKAGMRNDWMINTTDFAPTLFDLAGIQTPASMQGHSFRAALTGEKEPESWRQAIYYRYWMHLAHHHVPAHFGIRSKKHKLIFFYGTDFNNIHRGKVITRNNGNRFGKDTPIAWEFYDLEKDPQETHNRYHDPEYAEIIAKLKTELWKQRAEIGDTDSEYPKIQKIVAAHQNE